MGKISKNELNTSLATKIEEIDLKANISDLETTNSQLAQIEINKADRTELLDYEEGIWTPTLTFGAGSAGITFADRSGKYVRIGKTVTIEGRFNLSSKGTSTGAVSVGGLPFSRGVTTPFNVGFAISNFANIITPANTINLSGLISELPRFEVVSTRENALATNLTDANFTNTSGLRFIASYIIQ